MIAVRDLEVDLDRTPVLRGVTCEVPAGRWLALIGPNGAGKTTLLRAVAGLLPYRGAIVIGTGTGVLPRVVAYVPQEPELPPDMTVEDYVLLGRTPYLGYLGRPGTRDRDVALSAAGRLGMTALLDRRLARLSGGERKRAVLARALAQEPSVLLLDEPTASLDIGHQQQVLELIDSLRVSGGLTVLSTLHDLTTAGQYADSLVLLHEGRVEAAGPAGAVLTRERIARVYGARVEVSVSGAGVVVTPVR